MLGFGGGNRNIEPTGKIVRRKIILLIGRDDLRMPLVKEGKGTTRRADIHRLPKTVED